MPDTDGHIAPALRRQWMTEDEVIDRLIAYEAAFGEAHLSLACHAAFPLLVDAELVNLIRINFLGEDEVPWIAEIDFLLSAFCRPFEEGYYHVDPVAREVMLDILKSNLPNGRKRLNELADFVLAYSRDRQLLEPQAPVTRTHRWVAWSFLYPEKLADEIEAQIEAPAASGQRRSLQHVELITMVEIARGPLAEGLSNERYNELTDAARVMASYWYQGRSSVTHESLSAGSLAARVMNELAPVASPPVEADESPRSGLYPPKTDPNFVNRERETFNIVSFLTAGGFEQANQAIESELFESQLGAFVPKSVVALEGPKGVGKRALLAHIANQEGIRAHFRDGVIWIDGKEVESMAEVVRGMLDHLRLEVMPESFEEQVYYAVRTIVYRYHCLFVIADLDILVERDGRGWEFFWEAVQRGESNIGERAGPAFIQSQFLVSSRHVDWSILTGSVEPELLSLSPLTADASRELLERLHPSAVELEGLSDLVAATKHMPALIEQAAEWLEEELNDVARVIGRFDQKELESTVQRYLDQVERPEIRELALWVLLLRRISPETLYGVFIGDAPNPDLSVKDMAVLIDDLQAAGLVKPIEGPELYEVDRIVRQIVRMNKNASDPTSIDQFLQTAIGYYTAQEGLDARADEIYHRLWRNKDFQVLTIRWQEGIESYLEEEYDDYPMPARRFLARHLGRSLSERDLADYQAYLERIGVSIESLLEQAEQALNFDDFTGAREQYETIMRVLSDREEEDRQALEYMRLALTGMAKSLEGVGQEEDAEAYFKEALNYVELETGGAGPDGDDSRIQLVRFYRRHERFEQAFELLRKAIEIRIDELGEDSQYVHEGYLELADLHEEVGNETEAAELRRRWGNVERLAIEPEMVFVPAGEFLMGSSEADELARDDEKPQHLVFVSDFEIGKYPVTNKQYSAFIEATGREAPPNWEGGQVAEIIGDHPVVNVSWNEAEAYCRWLSERSGKTYQLPTEAQWEKVSRGTDGRVYPWGDEWDAEKLNSSSSELLDTTSVGRFSPDGDGPYGAADMVGNVWEWCADWYRANTYDRSESEVVQDPIGPATGSFRVLRGGSFHYDQQFCRCSVRLNNVPSFRDVSWGFRVVLLPSNR